MRAIVSVCLLLGVLFLLPSQVWSQLPSKTFAVNSEIYVNQPLTKIVPATIRFSAVQTNGRVLLSIDAKDRFGDMDVFVRHIGAEPEAQAIQKKSESIELDMKDGELYLIEYSQYLKMWKGNFIGLARSYLVHVQRRGNTINVIFNNYAR